MFLPYLPRPGIPAVRLLDVVPQRLWVLRVDHRLFLIDDLPHIAFVHLNSAIHILDDSVFAPIQLLERIGPKTSGAARCDGDHSKGGLPATIDRVGHVVAVAAIGGQPIVGHALRPSADGNHGGIVETLLHRGVVFLADFRIRIHQRDDVIMFQQPEVFRPSRNGTGLTDILLVTQDVHTKRMGNIP